MLWRAAAWFSSIAGSATTYSTRSAGSTRPATSSASSRRARSARSNSRAASLCGYFLEIALPVPDRELAKQYWERLGFVGLDEPDAALPHVSCTSDSIDIGLYDPAHLRLPTLMFDTDEVKESLARLAECRHPPSGPVPAPLRQQPAAMLVGARGDADPARERLVPGPATRSSFTRICILDAQRAQKSGEGREPESGLSHRERCLARATGPRRSPP